MLKWLLTLLIGLTILAVAAPWLRRHGIGSLPGDFRVRVRGRLYYIPLATTVLLSALVWGLGKLL